MIAIKIVVKFEVSKRTGDFVGERHQRIPNGETSKPGIRLIAFRFERNFPRICRVRQVAETAAGAQICRRPTSAGVPTKEIAKLPVIWTRLSARLTRNHVTRTRYAVDAKGRGRSSAIIHKMSANRLSNGSQN